MVYDAELDVEMSWRIIRVRLFLVGHTFEYIDSLPINTLGDIVGYWSGTAEAEQKLASMRK